MIHEVRFIAGVLHFLLCHAPGQLVNDGSHHLQMPQLLHTNIRQQRLQLRVWHGVALAEIPQGGSQLSVRPAVLADDEGRQFGIGVGDAYRVLQLLLIDKHQSEPPSSQGHGSLSHR